MFLNFYNFERENDYWGGEGVCCCQLKNTSILDFKVSLENYVWIGLAIPVEIPEETIVYTDSEEVCAEDYAFEIHEFVLNGRPEI